ncbi:MAG: hypothetical protein EHM28_05375 [Spirochaetaceae bacterium]|nr:MAG: hypothetical protein EHM28_05375 [Spirochaetaceae bacterium]
MKNDDVRIDKFYDGIETKRANGLMYLLFLWLVAFNPILVLLTGFPVIDFVSTYLPQLGHEWILALRPIIYAILIALAAAGILLGIGVNLLKRSAWRLLKVYLPLLQAVYLALLIPAFPLLEAVIKAGLFKLQPLKKYHEYLTTFITMIIASSIIFLLLFLYVLKSKKAKSTFSPEKHNFI